MANADYVASCSRTSPAPLPYEAVGRGPRAGARGPECPLAQAMAGSVFLSPLTSVLNRNAQILLDSAVTAQRCGPLVGKSEELRTVAHPCVVAVCTALGVRRPSALCTPPTRAHTFPDLRPLHVPSRQQALPPSATVRHLPPPSLGSAGLWTWRNHASSNPGHFIVSRMDLSLEKRGECVFHIWNSMNTLRMKVIMTFLDPAPSCGSKRPPRCGPQPCCGPCTFSFFLIRPLPPALPPPLCDMLSRWPLMTSFIYSFIDFVLNLFNIFNHPTISASFH